MAVALLLCRRLSGATVSPWNILYKCIIPARNLRTFTCRNYPNQNNYSLLRTTRNRRRFISLRRNTGFTFALLPGFLGLWKKEQITHTLSPDVLANIPREVMLKEPPKRKRNLIMYIIRYFWESICFFTRLTRIILTFTPLVAIYPIVCLRNKWKITYWKLLLWTMEGLGATFIKLGQWAGTRRDLFSAEFCDLFSRLHCHTMEHSWAVSKRKLRKAFGKRWREILVRVHKKPVGSGCIAQVHKAYMPADMIPDEALLDELLEDNDETDDQQINFADGLEIIGLSKYDDDDGVEDDQYSIKRAIATSYAPGNQQMAPVMDSLQSTDPLDHHSPDAASVEVVNDVISQAYRPSGELVHDAEAGEEYVEPQLIPVAVKILHPGIHRAVKRDLRILSGLVWVVEKIFPNLKWLSLQECMSEFTSLLTKQIDLRMEAVCLEQFSENFAENPNIIFPKPVRPYCKRSVLVETFEEGEAISNFLLENTDRQFPDGLKKKLALFGVSALLQMVFIDNFVHGDLHPGNILVQNADQYLPQDENKMWLVDIGDTVVINVKPVECPVKLVLLDVGIIASLNQADLQHFTDVFTAVIVGDGKGVADLLLCHSTHNLCKDIDIFRNEIIDIVSEARSSGISLSKIQVGKLLSRVFGVLSHHRVKMESNFASVLLAIFVLEGLGRSLDPDLDILEQAKPILIKDL